MFDIGFAELLLIAVLGLIIIGPQRLPEVIRGISLWIGRLRRGFANLKQEMEREFHLDDVRLQLHNEEVMRKLKESRQEIEQLVHDKPSQPTDQQADTPSVEASNTLPDEPLNETPHKPSGESSDETREK